MFQSLLIQQTRRTPYGTYLQGLVYLLARFLFALLRFLVDRWCLNSEKKEYDSLIGLLRRNCTSLPPSGETDAGMPSSCHALSALLSFLGSALFWISVCSGLWESIAWLLPIWGSLSIRFAISASLPVHASLYRVLLGILVNACFMFRLRATPSAGLSATSFPYVPAWALTQENCILHLLFSRLSTFIYIYIYIYIYIHTHTHTHTHIYIYIYSETCLNRTPYIPETWTNGK